jgi:beta-lactamase superfamily II metal-dependent hydrolase
MCIFHHPKIKTKEKLQEISTYVSIFLFNSTKDMRLLMAWGPQSKGKDSKVFEVGPHGSRASNDDQP